MSSNMNVAVAAEQIVQRGRRGLVNAAGDILTASTPRTPYKKGELRQNRRVIPTGNGADIHWGARHAGAQNAGGARGRTFKNYTTPGTGKDFVLEGLRKVLPNLARYFK